MGKITRAEILGPARYAPIRDEVRRRAMQKKAHRRLHLGDRVTIVFENRDTLIFQIEEMLRAESITSEEGIQQEIDVYNQLMPTEDELSATLFLEVLPGEDAKQVLHRFVGLDEHVHLVIGPHRVRARFEAGRQEEDRISAVQYTRYRLEPEVKALLATPGTKVAVEIDHPNYRHGAALSEAGRAALAEDLA